MLCRRAVERPGCTGTPTASRAACSVHCVRRFEVNRRRHESVLVHVRWRRLPAARRLVEPRVHQVPARFEPPVARRGQVDGGEPEDERANARPHPPGALRVDALRRVCSVLVPVRVPVPAAKPQRGRECERSRLLRPPRAEAVAACRWACRCAAPPAAAPPTPAAASASYACLMALNFSSAAPCWHLGADPRCHSFHGERAVRLAESPAGRSPATPSVARAVCPRGGGRGGSSTCKLLRSKLPSTTRTGGCGGGWSS